MSRLFTVLAFVPVVALLAETVYGMLAIPDLSKTMAWVLLVEGPTLILAIVGLQVWVERPAR